MGQNISMEGHPLLNECSGDEHSRLESSVKVGAKVIAEELEGSQDSSGDSDMKSNSVRAAIDSLIESCLGVKSDDSEGEDCKKDSEKTPKAVLSQLPEFENNTPAALNSVNMVVSFMKDRITNMIKNDDTEESDIIPPCQENAAVSMPKIVISKSPINHEREKKKEPSVCEPVKKEERLPKKTMRLQTLIDKVLDHSLGEDLHSSLPDIGHGELTFMGLSPLPRTSPETAQHIATNSKVPDPKGTEKCSDVKVMPNNMICLKDHIERVLERNFLNDELSKRSPTPEPKPIVPRQPSGGSLTHGKPFPNVDGNISVQDIVNRVISQTEVISKLLSPDGKESGDGFQKDNQSATGDGKPKHYSQEHFRQRDERFHHVHPLNKSPSRYSGIPSVHNEAYPETHNHWHKKTVPDGYLHPQHHYRMESSKHIDESAMYASMTSPNEGLTVQHHGQSEMAQPMNGTVPQQALMQNAPMYVMRGHPMYMPPRMLLPPPLMRADGLLPTDADPTLPHAATRNCRCVNCATYFQMEEKSKCKPSPVSPSGMINVIPSQADHQHYHGHSHLSVANAQSSNVPMHPDAVGMRGVSPSKFPHPVHMANMVQYRPPIPVKHMQHSGGQSHAEANAGGTYTRGPRLERKAETSNYRRDVYRREECGGVEYNPRAEFQARNADGPNVGKHDHSVVGSRADTTVYAHNTLAMPQVRDSSRHRPAPHPVLDLTVKVPETDVTIEQSGPASLDSDQPLDLSKKPSRAAALPRDFSSRREMAQAGHENRTDFAFHGSRPDMYHQEKQQNHAQPNYGWKDAVAPEKGMFGGDVPSNTAMVGMMTSPGGHRPQLHPIPAPTFSTAPSTMPALSPIRPVSQVSTSHSQSPSSYPVTQEKLSPQISTSGNYMSQSAPQQLRESPQPLPSPQGSDKGDLQRRGSVSRHEPIQSIIGNHPPNDILYLICRLCRQTYGSPYGFRKHFRNQHGFEPRAEHTIVQTISATKSAMQSPYALGSQEPISEAMVPSGRSSAPLERETGPMQNEFYRGRKDGTPSPMEQSGISPSSHSQQDWPSGKARAYRRGNEVRPRSSLREDSEDTKYLECPECKQTFQLNDFGSYKRHCRQHNQARASGSGVGSESQLRDSQTGSEQNEKHFGRTAACKICECRFSVTFLAEHIQSVHFKDRYSEGQALQSKKHLISNMASPNSMECRSPKQKATLDVSRSSPDIQKYLTEPVPTPYLEVQRLPADQITVTASPDSSSDKPGQSEGVQSVSSSITQPSPQVPDVNSIDSRICQDQPNGDVVSGSVSDPKPKELPYIQGHAVEDDKDSGFSGERCSSSESRSTSIESTQEGVSLASPAEGEEQLGGFYRHKKFGNLRKRKGSCENTDAKIPKLDHPPGARLKEDDTSAQSTVNEEEANVETSSDEVAKKTRVDSKEQEVPPPKKAEPRAKQEARHQLPFVWDRVTRIQAGKSIKPPDYMT